MKTLKDVTIRLQNEVGLSKALSDRIARKLNALAKSIEWATPLPDGARLKTIIVHRRARPTGRHFGVIVRPRHKTAKNSKVRSSVGNKARRTETRKKP